MFVYTYINMYTYRRKRFIKVEDDMAIRDLMLYTLNASDFKARVSDSVELWRALKKNRFILSTSRCPEDGITTPKISRFTSDSEIPIIATAKDSEFDKVIGLNSERMTICQNHSNDGNDSQDKAVLRRTSPNKPRFSITAA